MIFSCRSIVVDLIEAVVVGEAKMVTRNSVLGTVSFLSGSCAIAAFVMALTACGTGEFSGSNRIGKRAAEQNSGGPGAEPFPGDSPGKNPNDPFDPGYPFDPSKVNGPADPNHPNNQPNNQSGPNGPGSNPGTNPGTPGTPGTNPWIPGTGNPGNKPGIIWGNIVDIFKPLVNRPPQTNPGTPGSPTNPDCPPGTTVPGKPDLPNEIDFTPTGGRVFHIGDNAMDNSTCLGALTVTPLEGTAFYFEFEVIESSSQIQIEVVDICGVDYDTNTMRLIREGGNVVREGVIPKGTGGRGKASVDLGLQTLQPGKYQLRIESVRNPNKIFPSTPQGDRDDFIVGKVKVHSDRPLLKIGYRAGN